MQQPKINPFFWVPTLYFMQGLPYALVMLVAAIVLKQFNFPNSQIAFYTSLFIFPWVIKFFFAPFFENISNKRTLTIVYEYSLALITAIIGVLLYFQLIKIALIGFLLMAFVASWHDITSDGLYLSSLSRHEQISFIAIRTFAFQLARLFSQGGIVIAVGLLLSFFLLNQAWMLGFVFLALVMLALAIYHQFILSFPENPSAEKKEGTFFSIFYEFFTRKHILVTIIFLFFYNIAEAQLIKIVPLFLLDGHQAGGLNIELNQVGFIYGTLGMIAMLIGIFVSGWVIQRIGLRKSLLVMNVLLLLSHFGFLLISSNIDLSEIWVIIVILVTQFCFGLTNNAYMVYLLDNAREHRHSMSFYAISTGIMALGMLVPGAVSGFIQHHLGYFNFFIWIILLQAAVLGFTIFTTNLNNEHSIA